MIGLPDPHTPELEYRPVPVVWWLGAMFAQWLAIFAAFLLFWAVIGSREPLIYRGAFLVLTLWVAHFTWRRGMGRAHPGWQMFTGVTLLINLVATWIGVSAMG